jgi:hypothetical protein
MQKIFMQTIFFCGSSHAPRPLLKTLARAEIAPSCNQRAALGDKHATGFAAHHRRAAAPAPALPWPAGRRLNQPADQPQG